MNDWSLLVTCVSLSLGFTNFWDDSYLSTSINYDKERFVVQSGLPNSTGLEKPVLTGVSNKTDAGDAGSVKRHSTNLQGWILWNTTLQFSLDWIWSEMENNCALFQCEWLLVMSDLVFHEKTSKPRDLKKNVITVIWIFTIFTVLHKPHNAMVNS